MAIVHVPVPSTYNGVIVASADASLRERIMFTLNSNRWPVMGAHGGADALGKLESSDCDVLVLDRRLPDLDADELIATVRANYSRQRAELSEGEAVFTGTRMVGTGVTMDKITSLRDHVLE